MRRGTGAKLHLVVHGSPNVDRVGGYVNSRRVVLRCAMPAKRPARRVVRRRNPDHEFTASRVYYERMQARDWRVSEEELAWHLHMAETAHGIAKDLASFARNYPDAMLMTAEERSVLDSAARILGSIALPRSSFVVVARRMPVILPRRR